MERNTEQKTTRTASNPHQRPTQEDFRNLLKKLQKIMDGLGYRPLRERYRAQATKHQVATASASSQRGMLNVQTSYEQKEVPVFNTYEEYHKLVLQSFENISIILNIDGKVAFVSHNVLPLLGHHPEDIIGNSLLNIILDEQKDEVSEKITFNLPLDNKVGSQIEFCCYIRKRKEGHSGQDRYYFRSMCQRRDTYEYVKCVLYLQDSHDESFVFFGHHGPKSRNICSSVPRLLRKQRYYLVGNISVLRTPDELVQPAKAQTDVIVIESDDNSTPQPRRATKRRRRKKMRKLSKSEDVNMKKRPKSVTEVEIGDVQSATQQLPSELVHSSVSTTTSTNTVVRTSSSSSSTDVSTTTPVSTPTSGEEYMIDPKYLLEPQDMEFEVASEFLLNDSQEQLSTEEGECIEEDVKKPLEELKHLISKEYVIDKDSASHAASDDDCYIIEDAEDKKDPKIKEAILRQEQGHQKAPEASPSCSTTPLQVVCPETVVSCSTTPLQVVCPETVVSCSTTPVQVVRPEAMVEPIVRTDLRIHDTEPRRTYQFQRPLLGERFAQLCGPRVMTQVYDLSISRSFHDEPPSYTDIEEEEREQEQCEYELAQRIEMLRNLPYERPGQQQTGQGPRVYRPREQVVTVIDDLGPLAMNYFRNINSEHPRNETQRHREDLAPPLLHHSSRSCQEMTASCQVSALSRQVSAPSCQVSAASCQVSAASCQVSAPSCQVSAPSCQVSALSRQVSAPSCQVSAPSCQVSAPSCQVSAPSCQVSALSRQVSAPSCQVSALSRQVSAASCQVSAPSCQVSAPSCQVSAPSCQVSALSRQVSAPSCQVSAPSCQLSATSCQVSSPSYQIFAASRQDSAASRQAPAPTCQGSALSHQVFAPSCQASAVSHQVFAPPCQALASQQASTASCHPSAISHHASSDHRRENRPCFPPPGQDHSGYFRAEGNNNSHP